MSGDDDGYFAVNRVTGQITVKKVLNYEVDANANCDTNRACAVIVTATDSSGAPPTGTEPVTIAVAIAVTDVNETPTMIVGNKAVSVNERITGEAATPIDADRADDDEDTTDDPYTSSDPEEGTLAWSVSGTDGDFFEFANPTTGALTFKAMAGPNYEDAKDANKNNVYEITLEVSDGTNTATLDVKVTVKNVQETPGTINFSHLQPREGRSFTAILMDPDKGIRSPKWQWYDDDPDDDDSGTLNTAAAADAITGATSRSYIPKSGDVPKRCTCG